MSAAEPVQRPGDQRLAVGLTSALLHMVEMALLFASEGWRIGRDLSRVPASRTAASTDPDVRNHGPGREARHRLVLAGTPVRDQDAGRDDAAIRLPRSFGSDPRPAHGAGIDSPHISPG